MCVSYRARRQRLLFGCIAKDRSTFFAWYGTQVDFMNLVELLLEPWPRSTFNICFKIFRAQQQAAAETLQQVSGPLFGQVDVGSHAVAEAVARRGASGHAAHRTPT